MPSNRAKAVFDHGKTSSYPIKDIIDCQQSSKSTCVFKFVVQRETGNKRYDYEAESPKLAGVSYISLFLGGFYENMWLIKCITAEIVQTIKSMRHAFDRTSTVTKSRRSRLGGVN